MLISTIEMNTNKFVVIKFIMVRYHRLKKDT